MEKKRNLDNCLTDRVHPARVGGNLRQHEDPGGLDCPGGRCRQGPPRPGQDSAEEQVGGRECERQPE